MIEIRSLKPYQWPLLKAIRLRALADSPEAFGTTLAQALARTDAEWQENARRFTLLPPAACFLAFEADTPCGMANCFVTTEDPQVAELTAFWVAPERRGLGVAEALVADAAKWASAQTVTTLQAWVVEDNTRALTFYKMMGFSDTGQRQPHTPEPSKEIILLTIHPQKCYNL